MIIMQQEDCEEEGDQPLTMKKNRIISARGLIDQSIPERQTL